MKRLAFLSITLLFVMYAAYGQEQKSGNTQTKETKKERIPLKKLEGNNVSEIAKESFKADFGNLPNAKWKRSGTFDEVVFMKDGKEIIANYDIEGKLVGTTKVVPYAEVPDKGRQDIKNRYKEYTPGTTIFYDDNEANDTDMIMYGIQFDDADNYFVELAKGSSKIVVKVDTKGEVTFFKQL
jgi:hypothetical protein